MIKAVLVVAGLAQLLPGLLAFVAPGAFYDALAGYPPENHHFITDLGSWQIALGVAALYAATRVEWQVPMLGILTLQYALHAVSHVIDVGDSDPAWQGPFALVAQLVGVVVIGGLFVRERAR